MLQPVVARRPNLDLGKIFGSDAAFETAFGLVRLGEFMIPGLLARQNGRKGAESFFWL